jgi:hypothetical protein
MKNKNAIMVRYTGADWMRTYLVQRGDCKFWNGERWTRIRDEAKVYHDHKSAQVAATALQSAQYKGKPIRTFKCELNITLTADAVEDISLEELTRYLSAALRLDMENSTCGDGPVAGSFVQARLRLATLEETKPSSKVF